MLNSNSVIYILYLLEWEKIPNWVVHECLGGSSRDEIARIYNISTRWLANILNECRNNISAYIADQRELSIHSTYKSIISI